MIESFSKIVQLIKPKHFQTDIPCLDQCFMHHRIMVCWGWILASRVLVWEGGGVSESGAGTRGCISVVVGGMLHVVVVGREVHVRGEVTALVACLVLAGGHSLQASFKFRCSYLRQGWLRSFFGLSGGRYCVWDVICTIWCAVYVIYVQYEYIFS